MSWENVHVDDFGWLGRLDMEQDGVAVDISTYTTKEFFFLDPSGEKSEAKTAVFESDGVDGKLMAYIKVGDIDIAGQWDVFARITKPGAELTSDPHNFRVKDRL